MTDLEKMKGLIDKINEAAKAYYMDDAPIMSDKKYDELYDELVELEKSTGITMTDSPTTRPGGDVLESLKPVKHSKPMLSAAKTKSLDELIKFALAGFVDGNTMPGRMSLGEKEDGLTLVLRYKDGVLIQAITRGNGEVGEDVTHTVRRFHGIPLRIPYKEELEVRGEGLISWKNFNDYNASHPGEEFSHPRNMASGNTRKLDASSIADMGLHFIAFELVKPWTTTKQAEFEFLAEQGFHVVEHEFITIDKDTTVADLQKIIDRFDPETYAYPVDGLILEYADKNFGKSLGATGHHENCRIALKWQDETYATKFIGVTRRTTRTGAVSLTANFEPVKIEGSVVQHATLHNLTIFKSLKLGVGDILQVYKANKIIPAIDRNETQSNTYELPMTCPCCGEKLSIEVGPGGSEMLHCSNEDCSSRKLAQFEHFCSKPAANIEGLSSGKLEDLLDEGFVHCYADLYRLDRFHDDLVQMESWGERSYEKLQAALEKSKDMELRRFIPCFGIPMVGKHAGKDIHKTFHGDPNAFMEAVLDPLYDLQQIPNFGEIMATNLRNFFQNPQNKKDWDELMKIFRFKIDDPAEAAPVDAPLAGKSVVATGSFANYSRTGINETIEKYGGVAKSSVSKKTDYVIAGEAAGSKLTKAQALGIKILNEAEFRALIGEA